MIDPEESDRFGEMRRLAKIACAMDSAGVDPLWDEPPLDDVDMTLMSGPLSRRDAPPTSPKSVKREVARHV